MIWSVGFVFITDEQYRQFLLDEGYVEVIVYEVHMDWEEWELN